VVRRGIFAVALLALLAIPVGASASSYVHVTNPGAVGTLAPLAAATNVSNQLRVARTTSTSGLGHRTKSSGCHVRGQLPDPACTPGAIFVSATVSQICAPGYSRAVRNVPESVKQSVYAEYGIASHIPRSYEVDHLVPLELGGNNTVANLWPEA